MKLRWENGFSKPAAHIKDNLGRLNLTGSTETPRTELTLLVLVRHGAFSFISAVWCTREGPRSHRQRGRVLSGEEEEEEVVEPLVLC